jgi:hypothetical protein
VNAIDVVSQRAKRGIQGFQGSTMVTPQRSKSAVLRVAMDAPMKRAIAAIWASKCEIGRPARRRSVAIRAYVGATSLPNPRTREVLLEHGGGRGFERAPTSAWWTKHQAMEDLRLRDTGRIETDRRLGGHPIDDLRSRLRLHELDNPFVSRTIIGEASAAHG